MIDHVKGSAGDRTGLLVNVHLQVHGGGRGLVRWREVLTPQLCVCHLSGGGSRSHTGVGKQTKTTLVCKALCCSTVDGNTRQVRTDLLWELPSHRHPGPCWEHGGCEVTLFDTLMESGERKLLQFDLFLSNVFHNKCLLKMTVCLFTCR